MDFIFDQTQLPIIGSRFWDIVPTVGTKSLERNRSMLPDNANQSRRTNMSGTETNSLSSTFDISSWRRPLASQVGFHFSIALCWTCGMNFIEYSSRRFEVKCFKCCKVFQSVDSTLQTRYQLSSRCNGNNLMSCCQGINSAST